MLQQQTNLHYGHPYALWTICNDCKLQIILLNDYTLKLNISINHSSDALGSPKTLLATG